MKRDVPFSFSRSVYLSRARAPHPHAHPAFVPSTTRSRSLKLLGSWATVFTALAPRKQRHCCASPSAYRVYIRLRALQNANAARCASLYWSWRRRNTSRDARGDRSGGTNRRCARSGLQPQGHWCAFDVRGGSDSAVRAADRRGHVNSACFALRSAAAESINTTLVVEDGHFSSRSVRGRCNRCATYISTDYLADC